MEVLSLYVPGWVETDQIGKVAELLTQVDSTVPFTILAFFPEHKLINVPSPNFQLMIEAYYAARDAGLKNIKLGNIGRFVETEKEYETLSLCALRKVDVIFNFTPSICDVVPSTCSSSFSLINISELVLYMLEYYHNEHRHQSYSYCLNI